MYPYIAVFKRTSNFSTCWLRGYYCIYYIEFKYIQYTQGGDLRHAGIIHNILEVIHVLQLIQIQTREKAKTRSQFNHYKDYIATNLYNYKYIRNILMQQLGTTFLMVVIYIHKKNMYSPCVVLDNIHPIYFLIQVHELICYVLKNIELL